MVDINFICVKHWETFPKNNWKTSYIQHFFLKFFFAFFSTKILIFVGKFLVSEFFNF
jgi:hypothetical protein